MSSGIFILTVFLLVFNAASVAYGILPFIYGPFAWIQLAQIIPASIAFVFCLVLPCQICALRHKANRGYIWAGLGFFAIMLLDVGAAVFLTGRYQNKNLENDYKNVPKKGMVVLMAVIVYWAAAALAIICMVAAFFKAERKGKALQGNTYPNYQQRTPPRELQSAPAARPFVTTYGKNNTTTYPTNTYSNTNTYTRR